MKNNKLPYLIIFACILFGTSCNNFLDEMPDNRAELDTEDKIIKMLVSAYPEITFSMIAEMASDNTDDIGGGNNPNSSRFTEQLFNWGIVMDKENEDPASLWEANYMAIASANQALNAIEEMGNPATLKAAKAEALMARAYAHFVLVNVFSQHYSAQHSASDLGIPYMTEPETTLFPKYERGTVADAYEKIEKDILEALPNISEEYYTVPKYHFNRKAANAFVARFYLYYGNWDSAIKYATEALGSSPQNTLRDNVSLALIPRNPMNTVSKEFVKAEYKSNFMLTGVYSQLGLMFGGYMLETRFNHGSMISESETLEADGPWGPNETLTYINRPFVYEGANLNKVLMSQFPYVFEMKDPVGGTGFARTVHAVFTAEETLMVRAEAYILKKDYANALKDMNMWAANSLRKPFQFTQANITAWLGSMEEYKPEVPTLKKKLNPDFAIEAGVQTDFLHTILWLRRMETMHTGLRWFDVKRYGIEIYRRLIESGRVATVGDKLVVRDPRRARQLPVEIIDAGLEPNPGY